MNEQDYWNNALPILDKYGLSRSAEFHIDTGHFSFSPTEPLPLTASLGMAACLAELAEYRNKNWNG